MRRIRITIILLLIATACGGLFYYEGSLPLDASRQVPLTFVIDQGAPLNTIIHDLDKAELIRSKLVFYLLVRSRHLENRIQAGSFRLAPSMSALEIATALTQGSDDIWITIIEGTRKEEIAHEITRELNIPEAEFIAQAQEGTLFPDTYLFPRTATTEQVLSIFKANFDKKYSPELRAQARARGFTDNQVLTIASMVEREANTPEAMREVASIIVKRWKADWPLQIDATVQYILGYQDEAGTWWKKRLTRADLETPSLYNTYAHPGLPPAPIANPGLESIKAVINADVTTPYWFYISNKDGSKMIYSKTIEEHNENIARHLN